MKKLGLIAFGLLMVQILSAQKTSYQVLSNTEGQTIVDINVGVIKQIPIKTPNGIETKITIDKGTQLLNKSCPDLPKLAFSVIIPNQKNSSVSIVESQFTDYPNIHIAPSKGTLSRDIDPASVPFIYGDVYQKDAFFPNVTSSLNEPYVIRDFRGQTVIINPVQYNPVTKIMRVYTHLKIKVAYDGVSTDNTLEGTENPSHVVEEFDGIYQNHFINYRALRTRYSPIKEEGTMAIFCPATYLTEIAPFIKWKEMKGIKTYLVNTDTMTTVNETSLKNLAKYYYQTYHIAYLMLIGDHNNIPARQSSLPGPSDIAYAYITTPDHYPEFIVGRFSGQSTSDIKTQVDRSIQYEIAPNTSGNWMSTQIGIASEQGTGDDNQYDWEHIHDIVDSNKNQYNYLTNIELYDGPNAQAGTDAAGYPDSTMLKNAVNNGASLINYAGHGSTFGIITTNFETANVPSLNNVDKLPFLFVVGCSPGSFTAATCFAESMQRTTSGSAPDGSIASFMATISQYWDEPMQAQDEFNAVLRGARPNNLKSKLGAMCIDGCMSMIDQYDYAGNTNGPLAGSDMSDTWIFFGDPTLSLYTKNEGTLSISHYTQIQQNSTSFVVNCPVNGATIGLYYQGKYLAYSTVYGGVAYFSFPALLNLDTVFITATKQNYTPAFGSALVVNWATSVSDITNDNVLQIYPNPVGDMLQVTTKDNTLMEKISIIDVTGKIVLTQKVSTASCSISTDKLASGVYMIQITTKNGIYIKNFSKE